MEKPVVPWPQPCVVKIREEFILRALEPYANIAELCREFGISRKTGYKWAGRCFELGAAGLADGSRRPHSSPTAIDPGLADALVGARKRYPFFGPRKLRAFLAKHNPHIEMPAASTIGEILRRHGLLRPRRRRRVAPPATQPFGDCTQPNDLWCTDFKGHFPVGDGLRCHPLTISDAMSRFLVRCDGVTSPDEPAVRPIFVQARWGHINRHASWLTRMQAILLDGHFVIEQTARDAAGCLLSFNGTRRPAP